MWVQSLGGEDPQEEGMATYSSILAWRIPWTEERGGIQSIVLQRVRNDWSDWAHTPHAVLSTTLSSGCCKELCFTKEETEAEGNWGRKRGAHAWSHIAGEGRAWFQTRSWGLREPGLNYPCSYTGWKSVFYTLPLHGRKKGITHWPVLTSGWGKFQRGDFRGLILKIRSMSSDFSAFSTHRLLVMELQVFQSCGVVQSDKEVAILPLLGLFW